MKRPLVSISCLTYNQVFFIRECLDSFIMQKTNFDFEVIIHDDASTDGTREVIEEYCIKYPAIFLPIYQTENQYSKGVKGMMARFNFPRCQGKYIALCEGDDYWTDPLKLQKQVDFLEGNEGYVMSFHNAEIIYSANNKKHLFIEEYKKQDYTANDILSLWLIPTASMVFRNVFNGDFPIFLSEATHGDLALQVYLNEFGKFRVMGEVMSVYRINEGSITVNSFSGIKYNNNIIRQLKSMNKFFKDKYKTIINKRIFLYYLENADLYRTKSIFKPLYWLIRAIIFEPTLVFFYKKSVTNSLKIITYSIFVYLKLKKVKVS